MTYVFLDITGVKTGKTRFLPGFCRIESGGGSTAGARRCCGRPWNLKLRTPSVVICYFLTSPVGILQRAKFLKNSNQNSL